MRFITLLLVFALSIVAVVLSAQIDPNLVKSEIAKTGFSEEQIREKLLEKGIDIDQVSPQELPKMEGAIRAAIAELEAEKKAAQAKNVELKAEKNIKEVAGDAAVEIKDAVENGKQLDEAISEEILEETNNIEEESSIYGHHIFRNNSIKVFNQAAGVRAPDTYELGPKDVINVSIWGYSELSKAYEVTTDGYIKPDRMAPIFVKGISLGNAKKLLRKSFARYYNFKNDEFDVNLNYSRTITINITGEAIHPGSYTIPAVNTAFNALVASGGPSDIGSVREITLVRAGKTPVKLDVYEFLSNPNVAQNMYLQDGDFIHIPVAKKVVAVGGSIVKPFRYELKANENLSHLINYAGGFNANAYRSKIQIKRFQNGEQKLIDIAFQKQANYALLNGDKINVFAIPTVYENFVEITGTVTLPGEYELEKGWRIADLLGKGKLLPESKLDFAFLQRKNNDGTYQFIKIDLAQVLENNAHKDNLLLQAKDKLMIYAQSQFVDQARIQIAGAVRNPIDIPFDRSKRLRVEDLVQMASGLAPKATTFAFIYRKKEENSKDIEYLTIDLTEAMANPLSASNIVLEPHDRIFIPSNDTYLDDAKILISGAVRLPGDYDYDISLTLDKLLLMAGGLKQKADRNRIEIFRINFDEQPIQTEKISISINENGEIEGGQVILLPYDEVRVRQLPEFELQKNITIEGEVAYPGIYSITKDNEKLMSLIEKAGGVTDEAFLEGATLLRYQDDVGYIILRLDEVFKNKKSKFNIVLAKGDVLNIPKMKDFVSIQGATKVKTVYNDVVVGDSNKINVPFHPGRRANYYVDEYAGGTNKQGRKRLITVKYPNGQLKETKNFLLFKVYPKIEKGAEIYVGAVAKKKQDSENEKTKEPIDWGKLLGDSMAQATTIITLLLLIQRIN